MEYEIRYMKYGMWDGNVKWPWDNRYGIADIRCLM